MNMSDVPLWLRLGILAFLAAVVVYAAVTR